MMKFFSNDYVIFLEPQNLEISILFTLNRTKNNLWNDFSQNLLNFDCFFFLNRKLSKRQNSINLGKQKSLILILLESFSLKFHKLHQTINIIKSLQKKLMLFFLIKSWKLRKKVSLREMFKIIWNEGDDEFFKKVLQLNEWNEIYKKISNKQAMNEWHRNNY